LDFAEVKAIRRMPEPMTIGDAIKATLMMATLEIDSRCLPIIWDADFLYGPRSPAGEESYVLCEINVSSVFAIPDQASAAIARQTQQRLQAKSSLVALGPRVGLLAKD
jgi:hypothetical protein